MVKHALALLMVLLAAGCELPSSSEVLYRCDPGDVCPTGFACWSDDYCHPDSDGAEPSDAGSDAGVDGGADAGLDAGTDAGLDAGGDAGLDAGVDGGGDDGGVDAGGDAGTEDAGLDDAGLDDAGLDDAGADAGADAGLDAGVDGGVDAGPCVPLTACPGSVECGRFDAGCGVALECGQCLTPEECGTVTANVCGLPKLCTQGFCWENPLPQGNTLLGAFSLGPRAVWAVGELGTVLFWNGERSSLLDVGTTADLRAVFATSETDVYVAGDQGVVVHFTGGGWQREPTPGVYRLNALWAAPGGTAFAAANGGYILKREPTGTWSEMGFAAASTLDLLSLVGLDTGELFATSLARVWRLPSPTASTWQGDTSWMGARDVVRLATWGGQLFAASKTSSQNFGVVLERQPDAGWRQFGPNVPVGVNDLTLTGPSNPWVVTPAGLLVRFEADGGQSSAGFSRDAGLLAVAAVGPKTAFVAGPSGTMALVDDAGVRELFSGGTTQVNAVCGYSDARVYGPGNSSIVYERRVSIDGVRWDAVPRTTSNTWHWLACFAAGPDKVWVTGDDRQFLVQSGGVFVIDDLGNNQDWNGVWGSATGPWYFVGSSSWLSSTATGTMPSYQLSLISQPQGIWGVSNDDIIVVGAGGQLQARSSLGWANYPPVPQPSRVLNAVHGQRLPDGGTLFAVVGVNTAWRRVGSSNFVADTIDAGNALRGVWVTPTGDIWAAGDDGGTAQGRGVLWRYAEDGGWAQQVPPTRAAFNDVGGWGDTGPFLVGQGGVILRRVGADGG